MSDAPLPPVQSLRSPQTVVALYLITIAACTVGGVFWKGSPELIATMVGVVVGGVIGSVTGFYFGSSTGSQAKDDKAPPASLPPVP